MKRSENYILTKEEYNELNTKLDLLEESIRDERNRLRVMANKSDSEVISLNKADYHLSLLYDIKKLSL